MVTFPRPEIATDIFRLLEFWPHEEEDDTVAFWRDSEAISC